MMKNKYLLIAAFSLFIIIAGVCYSYSYVNNHDKNIVLSSLVDEPSHNEDIVIGQDYGDKQENLKTEELKAEELKTEELKVEEQMICVHICGAVVRPDVYQVKVDARLIDLIDAAGGLISSAAGDYVNQALIVKDGQRIYIPTKDELNEMNASEYMKGDQSNTNDSSDTFTQVNINSSDEIQLMTLPGIGQAKAKNIIEYRKKNGNFREIGDLMNVPGIKEGLFNQVADLITVQ